MPATDPLTPRQRRLVTTVRRGRPFYWGLVVVGGLITLGAAGYSLRGVALLRYGRLVDPPIAPRHLHGVAARASPDRAMLLDFGDAPERERQLRQALVDEGTIRVRLLLLLIYATVGLIGVPAGLLMAGVAYAELRWQSIVDRLDPRR